MEKVSPPRALHERTPESGWEALEGGQASFQRKSNKSLERINGSTEGNSMNQEEEIRSMTDQSAGGGGVKTLAQRKKGNREPLTTYQHVYPTKSTKRGQRESYEGISWCEIAGGLLW